MLRPYLNEFTAAQLIQHIHNAYNYAVNNNKQQNTAIHDTNQQLVDRNTFKVMHTYCLGYTPSTHECTQLYYSIIHGNDNHSTVLHPLTLSQSIELLLPKLQQRSMSNIVQQLFYMYDTDNKGYITYSDVYTALHCIIPHIDDSIVRQCYNQCDTQHDGMIGYKQFEDMMRQNIDTLR